MPWFIGKLGVGKICTVNFDWLEAQKFVLWTQERGVTTKLFVRDTAQTDVNIKLVNKKGLNCGDTVAVYITSSKGRLQPKNLVPLQRVSSRT